MNEFVAHHIVTLSGGPTMTAPSAIVNELVVRLSKHPLPIMCGANAVALLQGDCISFGSHALGTVDELRRLKMNVDALITQFLNPKELPDHTLDTAATATPPTAFTSPAADTAATASVDKLTVAQLKAKCHAHGLLTSGSRDELKVRYLRAQARGIITATPPVAEALVSEPVENAQMPLTENRRRIRMSDFLSAPRLASRANTTAGPRSKPTVLIAIDKRERARVGGGGGHQCARSAFVTILESAAENLQGAACALKVVSHTLPCGDFSVFFPIHNTNSSDTVVPGPDWMDQYSYAPVAVERKTFHDLLGSVVNAHLAEQKELMRKADVFKGVAVLIIEGSSTEWARLKGEERQRILSSSVTTGVVDRFRVIWTRSPVETAAFVVQLAHEAYRCFLNRCRMDPTAIAPATPPVRGSEVAILRLRHTLHQQSMAIRMLSCAPNVSTNTAREILGAFTPATSAGVDRSHLLRSGTMMSVWRLSRHIRRLTEATGLVNRDACNDTHADLARVLSHIQQHVLDNNSKKKALALLTHFMSSDAY